MLTDIFIGYFEIYRYFNYIYSGEKLIKCKYLNCSNIVFKTML